MNQKRHRINLIKRGQTLVIALIVLFVLLIIGFVFIGILNRNIIQASTSQQRSLSADLADAGIRYVQSQLLNNPKGADWRPNPTLPLVVEDSSNPPNVYTAGNAPNNKPLFALDPDIYWIRPASLKQNTAITTSGFFLHSGDAQVDMGGPDGLGPFTRVQFRNGRALIRVRYAPSDVDITQPSQSFGPLRQPGKAHNYLIIESVGRPGVVNASDPTTIPPAHLPGNVPPTDAAFFNAYNGAIEYQFFNIQSDLQTVVSLQSQYDNQFVQSRKLMAFASIGIIDDALYITNRSHTSTPADLGEPFDLGETIPDSSGTPQPVMPTMNIGSSSPNPYRVSNSTTWAGGGGVWINGNALVYGVMNVTLNAALGEAFCVAGTVGGVNAITPPTTGSGNAQLNLYGYSGSARYDGTGTAPTGASVVSTAPGAGQSPFSGSGVNTFGGLFRDGYASTDSNGYPRGVAYKESPDITRTNPDTGMDRYLTVTRDSGTFGSSGNTGQYGHGKGVYVNNAADLQTQNDETGRLTAGSVDALFNDWLNPNNGQTGSGWQGPYYVPAGAYLQLEPDGFLITLDGSGSMPTWRTQTGTDTANTRIRYRIGGPVTADAPEGWIIDSYENLGGASINDPSISSSTYTTYGQPFNGVLYFEGNVRVRGVTPTIAGTSPAVGVPLTIVSMGNIYIEGSITKGVQQATSSSLNLVTQTPQAGVALLARDYVVLNTTQFFGPADTPVTVKNSVQNPAGFNPVMMPAANGEVDLFSEFLLDPDSTPTGMSNTNPNNWASFMSEYTDASTGTAEATNMLLAHTMDDGPGSNAYTSLLINNGLTANSNYLFPQPDGTTNPIYALGQENYQRYSAFESRDFQIYPINAGVQGTYSLGMLQTASTFQFQSPTYPPTGTANDYLIARSAIVPEDIRVEAVIYAQEGSFFVIPGEWFNPRPADTRQNYLAAVASTGASEANLDRLQNYGNYPAVPFYQEPLDVKITIFGSINENMPPPISQQTEWYKKWGWIPAVHGATGEHIPTQHNDPADGFDVNAGALYVPNLFLKYDPVLATGRINGFTITPGTVGITNPAVRPNPQDPTGLSMLPPYPCLPICPTLFYFGEDNPNAS